SCGSAIDADGDTHSCFLTFSAALFFMAAPWSWWTVSGDPIIGPPWSRRYFTISTGGGAFPSPRQYRISRQKSDFPAACPVATAASPRAVGDQMTLSPRRSCTSRTGACVTSCQRTTRRTQRTGSARPAADTRPGGSGKGNRSCTGLRGTEPPRLLAKLVV